MIDVSLEDMMTGAPMTETEVFQEGAQLVLGIYGTG